MLLETPNLAIALYRSISGDWFWSSRYIKDAKMSWRKKTCWRRPVAVVAGSFGSFISFFLSGNWSATSAIYLHRGRTLQNVPGLYWIYLNKILSSRPIMLRLKCGKTWIRFSRDAGSHRCENIHLSRDLEGKSPEQGSASFKIWLTHLIGYW